MIAQFLELEKYFKGSLGNRNIISIALEAKN